MPPLCSRDLVPSCYAHTTGVDRIGRVARKPILLIGLDTCISQISGGSMMFAVCWLKREFFRDELQSIAVEPPQSHVGHVVAVFACRMSMRQSSSVVENAAEYRG